MITIIEYDAAAAATVSKNRERKSKKGMNKPKIPTRKIFQVVVHNNDRVITNVTHLS